MNIDPLLTKPYKPPSITPLLANAYVERIEKHLNEFITDLKEDETYLLNVLLNDGNAFNPTSFRSHNPHMIIVEGHDSMGNESMALLNQNDIQIVITKLKKAKTTENSENLEFIYQ